MVLNLQSYLRNSPHHPDVTLKLLTDELGIKVKRHPSCVNLVLFKYDQIESPMGNPIVQECRGIILDQDRDWEVVSFPFVKFFNSSEHLAAEIDWSTASVLEKIDGSLMSLYCYKGIWRVASSGTPDAGGDVQGLQITFGELFWDIYHATNMKTFDMNPTKTYMFEMTSPYNRIVVPHKESKLTLIGIRDNVTLQEESVSTGPEEWPKVKSFSLTSAAEVDASFESFQGINQEGYVVVDGNFNRVKCKHPQYVALHHMRGNGSFTMKRALALILGGEVEEVLGYFPEWKPSVDSIQTKLESLIGELEVAYERIKDLPLQKDFAAVATQARCPSVLFLVRAKKADSIKEGVSSMRIESLMEVLGISQVKEKDSE
jgi:hypothetical protein